MSVTLVHAALESHAFAFRRPRARQGQRAVIISCLTKYATPMCVACRRRRLYFYLRATISRQSRFALPPDPFGARACANTCVQALLSGQRVSSLWHPSAFTIHEKQTSVESAAHQLLLGFCNESVKILIAAM